MKKTGNKGARVTTIREKAEDIHRKKQIKSDFEFSEAKTLQLIHELEVHQIELEMQNEELVLAKEQAELATEKYTELYDFSPSGYFILSCFQQRDPEQSLCVFCTPTYLKTVSNPTPLDHTER